MDAHKNRTDNPDGECLLDRRGGGGRGYNKGKLSDNYSGLPFDLGVRITTIACPIAFSGSKCNNVNA